MSLLEKLQPLPGDAPDFDTWLEDVPEAARSTLEKAAPALGPLFAGAPYLRDMGHRHAEWLAQALDQSAGEAFAAILEELTGARGSTDEIGIQMRAAKGRVALLSAVAETGGVWTARDTTAALADLADATLDAGLAALLAEAAEKGVFAEDAGEITPANCGLTFFALGKHGGRELNYSSDIDVVAFFDADKGVLADPLEATRTYARLVRNLVGLMEERTEHGYVFRTDLRLRPDPGSTPVALPFDGALTYYEARGQNWERAAWIKARPCAGDKQAGEAFLDELAPFIWRKHLDFATITDIQAMKRQINIARKVGEARVAGHNVKLGRGGIREIEFFTQTQQLIAGGRDLGLRVRPTAEGLAALAASGWITEKTATDLTGTYWFLRAVENRVQMVGDEQTHSLPEDEDRLANIARLMGMDLEAFKQRYRAALDLVTDNYAELFTEGESLASDLGDLVFTGSDDDPGTLETLSGIGFADPAKAAATIRKWHYGGYPATRASAARAHLTEFLPVLLTTIAATGNADEVLAKFDHFLSRFPAGVQLFSLLRNHHHLCRMLVAFMASAPRLAEAVIHRAHVMDGLIDPAFAEGVSSSEILVERVSEFLDEARSFEDRIDRARIIGQEQKFLVSAGFVSGTVDAAGAGRQFTNLAETLLGRLMRAVQEEFAQRHGHIRDASIALLGFGKMASYEMTASSDLDFIMLYQAPSVTEESDGEKPLAATQYFARMTQRLVAALSAPTAEGVLYEADMRLRPSGNAGPLATGITGFRDYQLLNAWTWEHLALTRARVVYSGGQAGERVDSAIADILSQPRDPAKTIADVIDMRERLARDRKPRHPFDLKLAGGGLIDLEFVAQSAQLVAGSALDVPQAPVTDVLTRMAATGLLPEAERLAEVHRLYTTILQAMSICLTDPFSEGGWTGAFRDLLIELTNYPDFERLQNDLEEMQQDVQRIAAGWYEKARNIG